ncbi:hypothetical protein Tco_1499085 [Tanacetum coccineum]
MAPSDFVYSITTRLWSPSCKRKQKEIRQAYRPDVTSVGGRCIFHRTTKERRGKDNRQTLHIRLESERKFRVLKRLLAELGNHMKIPKTGASAFRDRMAVADVHSRLGRRNGHWKFKNNYREAKMKPYVPSIGVAKRSKILSGAVAISRRLRKKGALPANEKRARTAEKATQATSQGTGSQETSNDQSCSSKNSYRGQRGRGGTTVLPMTMNSKEILATEGANFPKPPQCALPEEQRVGKRNYWFNMVKTFMEGQDKQKERRQKDAPRDKGHDIHSHATLMEASARHIVPNICFQRLRPEVKSQLNPATTSLTGFTGEKIWPMGQLRLPVMVGNKEHSTPRLD